MHRDESWSRRRRVSSADGRFRPPRNSLRNCLRPRTPPNNVTYFNDPAPTLTTQGDTVILKKELRSYPNYGVVDGSAGTSSTRAGGDVDVHDSSIC